MRCLACPEPVWAWQVDLPESITTALPVTTVLCREHAKQVLEQQQQMPVWPKCPGCAGNMYLARPGLCARCTYNGHVAVEVPCAAISLRRATDRLESRCQICDKIGWLYPMRNNIIRCEEHASA